MLSKKTTQMTRRTIKIIVFSLLLIILISVVIIGIIYTVKTKRTNQQIDLLLASPVPSKIERRSQLASCLGKRIQLWGQMFYRKGDPEAYLLIYGNPSLRLDLKFSNEEKRGFYGNKGTNAVVSGVVAYYFEPYNRRCHFDVYTKGAPDYLRFMLLYPKLDRIVEVQDISKLTSFRIKEMPLEKDASFNPFQPQDAYLDLRYCLRYLIETRQ